MNLTESFIAYLEKKAAEPVPERVVRQAEKCLLDYLGAAFSGASETRQNMSRYLRCSGRSGPCSIIGLDDTADAATAAFVNGFNAHVMELDDGHRFGMIHLAAPVTSAVLAAAQAVDAGGDLLLKGIIMGYEAAVRLAVSIQPEHKKRGFHTAGTCGTIGAAVGAGVVLGLDPAQMKAALSAAGASAAGLLEIQEEGSQLKPYNTGNAAMSGVNAAFTALTGFCGPDDILGGPRGMTRLLADGPDEEKMTADTPEYEIERVYLKPYAACRHCHSVIEAAAVISERLGASPDDIESITVRTYRLAVKGHDHTDIQGVPSAKLSIPFCAAAAYLHYSCGPETFTEKNAADPRILSLTKRVRVEECSEFSELSPARRIAEVTVLLKNGAEDSHRVDFAKGDPENPMTREEVVEKFNSLMSWASASDRAEAVISAVSQDPSKIYELL